MSESLEQRRRGFRALRKILSMETLMKSKEDDGDKEEVECISVKVKEKRRNSLNPECPKDQSARTDEFRTRLLRLQSFQGRKVDDDDEAVMEGKNKDVFPKRRMGEAAPTGKASRCPPITPLPLRSPSALNPPMSPPFGGAAAEGQVAIPEKGLEELLECPVCLERLSDPRTLPCDHTFCLQCLKVQLSSPIGISDGQSGVIKCPVCRKDASIPRDGGLSSLPINVYLQSLLRLLSAREPSQRSKPSSPDAQPHQLLPPSNACTKCGAVGLLHLYICGHCRQVLCSQCLPVHFAELRERMGHIRNQIQTVSQRLREAEKGFTERFEQLRSQVKDETEKRLAQVSEESSRLLERIKALETKRLEDGRSLVGSLESASETKNVEAFDASATEGKVEIFMKIHREAAELISQATRWNEVLRSRVTFDRSSFRILDPQDEEDEEEAEEKGEEEDGYEEEEEGDEMEEVEKEVTGGDEEKRREKADGRMRGARRWEAREGKAEGSKGDKRATEEGERGGSRRRSVPRTLPTTHDELSLYYRSRSMSAPRWCCGGPKGGSGAGELYRPAGMGVAPWRGGTEIYVALSDGGKVSVFTKRTGGNGWRYSRSLSAPPTKEKTMCPFGVAFSEKKGEVYVTDKWCHCIHVYDSEGNWIRRLCKQGRSPGCLSSPEGIAASNGYLFVADTGNDRVQILDAADGGFVSFVGSELAAYRREVDYADPSPGSGVLMQPTGVALTADESKLVVCDSGHNRIKIFDVSGLSCGDCNIPNRPTCVFGSLGSQKGQLRSARGVAVDKMGFVTVADSGNARIQIFRPDGRLVRAFGSKGREAGQFGYPTAVHIGASFELFVSDATNHCMYIF